jgi:hypothetical protein
MRVSLGYLGVIVQVRLFVEPSFNLRAKTRWVDAKELLATGGPQALVAGCDFGEMIWFPQRGSDTAPVNVICANKTTDSGNAFIRLLRPPDSDDPGKTDPALDHMQNRACKGEQLCEMEHLRAITMRYWRNAYGPGECANGFIRALQAVPQDIRGLEAAAGATFLGGALDPGIGSAIGNFFAWCCTPDCNADEVGKWHQMMSSELTPPRTRPFERDWEIYIPGNNALAAIQTAKAHFAQTQMCLPLIGVFLRFAPAEDGTLIAHTVKESPAQGQPGMFFEIVVFLPKGMRCGDQARFEKVYDDLAVKLVSPPINGRAHWGKNRRSLFQLQRRLGTYGDNMKQFREVVKQLDPKGMFANQLGVDIGLRWPEMTKAVPSDSHSPACTPDPPAPPQPAPPSSPLPPAGSSPPAPPATNPCARCPEQEAECLASCGGESFCTCTCSNQFCACRKACGSQCRMKICQF